MAMTYATSGVVMIQTIVCFVYKLAECTDISDVFRFLMSNPRCKSASADDHMMVGHIAVGVVVDIILLFLPVWILYTKMLRSKRMTQGILVFCVGVLAVGLGITRLVINVILDFTIDPYVAPSAYTLQLVYNSPVPLDRTYKMAINGVFSDLEGHVGLWCGCFPAMSSIIKLVGDKLSLGSGRGNTNLHGSHSVNVGRRSAWKGADRGYEMKGLGVDREESDSQRSIVAAADRNAGESAQSAQWATHQQTELTLTEETASTSDRDGDYTAHLRLSRNTDPGSP
ncbi:hypothetical protein VPNG_08647 [Cytospora leucostoma]|uniref:Rhodopsin domain-containing protein n=1 Tax=Cytospora leucostoma TaxID=1230097 RepID=A0A423W396_9PEZI|nr:hypothetical protein VPNG_08647 [Cytospora leucostoma]